MAKPTTGDSEKREMLDESEEAGSYLTVSALQKRPAL
jgi:hypothetical protein